jgi:hypothetical protein
MFINTSPCSVIITLLQRLQKSGSAGYEILCISPFWRLDFKVTPVFFGNVWRLSLLSNTELILQYRTTYVRWEHSPITTSFYAIHWSLPVVTVVCLQNINCRFHNHHQLWRVRLSACSLTPRLELVSQSFPRASYISPFFMFNLHYPGYPVCVHSATEELQTMVYHLIVPSWRCSTTVQNDMQNYRVGIN